MPCCPVRPPCGRPTNAPASKAVLIAERALVALVGLTVLSGCGPVSTSDPGSAAGPAATRTTGDTPTVSTGPVPLPSPALRSALGCPTGIAVRVDHRLDVATTHPATVVVAHCDSAAGSPPSGVYVVTRPGGGGAATRISATLVPASAEIEVQTLTQEAGTLRVTGVAYSAATVPRCCPDVTVRRSWKISGDRLDPVG